MTMVPMVDALAFRKKGYRVRFKNPSGAMISWSNWYAPNEKIVASFHEIENAQWQVDDAPHRVMLIRDSQGGWKVITMEDPDLPNLRAKGEIYEKVDKDEAVSST